MLSVERNSPGFDVSAPAARIMRPAGMTNPRGLLERDIERQLRWGPKSHVPPILVTANADPASLLDAIDLHGETRPAWETASRVGSEGTISHHAAVKLLTDRTRRLPASELALSSQVLVPTGLGIRVHDGSVTLEGQITWNYRRDAERAIHYLSNAIGFSTLQPPCSVAHVNQTVESALRALQMDAAKE